MTPDYRGEIAKRAYSIWEIEGRPSGRDLDHWLRAEAEVRSGRSETVTKVPTDTDRIEVTATPPTEPQRPATRRARRT